MAVPLTSVGPLRPIIARRPFGILSDIDGTISPIVPTPEEAYVPDEICRLLSALAERGVRIGLVTGRPLAEARARVRVEGIAYAGNHGLELWVDGREERAPGAEDYVSRARHVLAELSGLTHPGVWVEDKGPVVTVHYRQSPDPESARAAVLAAIEASSAAGAFRVHEGKRVVELRPPLPVDKGSAARDLARRFGLRGVLCLGDDSTDADMFRAVRGLGGPSASLRAGEGGLTGACIAVDGPETTEAVLAAADYSVEGVEGVERLLREVLSALEAGGAP
ncbi:MAG: trehalose-phosphatase [Chloroflexi bacterium]|nr:trehalose-phosphatase [Chloroflexota bacterium]